MAEWAGILGGLLGGMAMAITAVATWRKTHTESTQAQTDRNTRLVDGFDAFSSQLQASLARLTARVATIENENEALREKIRANEAEMDSLRTALATVQRESAEFCLRIEELETENRALRARLVELEPKR